MQVAIEHQLWYYIMSSSPTKKDRIDSIDGWADQMSEYVIYVMGVIGDGWYVMGDGWYVMGASDRLIVMNVVISQ